MRDAGEPLPSSLRAREVLPLRADALAAVHRPGSLEEAETGRSRLAFDELVVLQLALARTAAAREEAFAEPFAAARRAARALPRLAPVHAHGAPGRAIAELDADLGRGVPMQRLLQGDVGSGKTVVALYALLRAVEEGRQGALMAPTETLAEQHFLTIDEPARRSG